MGRGNYSKWSRPDIEELLDKTLEEAKTLPTQVLRLREDLFRKDGELQAAQNGIIALRDQLAQAINEMGEWKERAVRAEAALKAAEEDEQMRAAANGEADAEARAKAEARANDAREAEIRFETGGPEQG